MKDEPPRFKPVGWTKNHIRKRSDAYKEGAIAAKSGAAMTDCPYRGFINAEQRLRVNWCAGFSSIKVVKPKTSTDTQAQIDLEQWLNDPARNCDLPRPVK